MTEVIQQQAVRADVDRLRDFCTKVFKAAGCSDEDAAIGAGALVSADLRGTHTHGTHYLVMYAKFMRDGGLNPKAKPRIVDESGAIVRWDGDGGLGHIVGYHVIQDAIRRVKESGLGLQLALVRGSSHLGAVGYYALQAAKADLIGFSMSNTPPVAIVPGGTSRLIGNAPFSYGVPANSETDPLVFDAAWTTSAGSRLALYARRGEQLPGGWAVDAQGKPTTNPNALTEGGALTTVQSHKGYGMIFLVEVLTAVLSGGPLMTDLKGFEGWSHAFVLIDPSVLMPIDEFKTRLGALVKVIHDSPRAEGVDHLYVPGEPEIEHEADSRANGIELGQEIWSELVQAGEEFGLSDELEATRV